MRPILDVASVGHKPKLLDQVRNVIRRRHYSIRTEQAYVDWIKRFIIYHNKRHPAEMAEEEVAQFLTSYASDIQITPPADSSLADHRNSSLQLPSSLKCELSIGSSGLALIVRTVG